MPTGDRRSFMQIYMDRKSNERVKVKEQETNKKGSKTTTISGEQIRNIVK